MIKKTFIVIIFSLMTGQIFACGGSYQYRLFPIGIINGDLVIIETSLNKYWDPSAGTTIVTRNRWKGTITLKKVDKQGQFKTLQFIDTVDILDRDYSKELMPFFDTAYFIASNLTDFQAGKNPTIEFCNFKKDCKTLGLISSTAKMLTVKTNDENEFEIAFPEVVVQQSESSGGIANQDFKINSIRTISIGENKLIVANFAFGEEQNTDFNKQTKFQQQCTSLSKCVYKELTLYHGLSFDAIIWD